MSTSLEMRKAYQYNEARHRYVVGFAFDQGRVLLVKKVQPEWQYGLFNGVGGKCKGTDATVEKFDDAMIREAREELAITDWQWLRFATLTVRETGAVVACYACKATSALTVRVNDVGEPLVWIGRGHAQRRGLIPNLAWLLPMAKMRLTDDTLFAEVLEERPGGGSAAV